MLFPRVRSRVRTLLLALFLVSVITWCLSRSRQSDGQTGQVPIIHNPKGHIKFWRQFEPLLSKYEPKCLPPERLGSAESIRFEQADPDYRPELIEMSAEDVAIMKKAHHGFVSEIKKDGPKLHYESHTRGIVSTAGGSYLPVLVISLRMLRRTGSEIPMEVFLADGSEYEEYICEMVLPSLNARCVVLWDILSAIPDGVQVEKYQYKLFAMLFSSFEEIFFLDADAFPLMKPESVFASEPFRSSQMITWPDFWLPTPSSLFYEISSIPVPRKAQRQSSESGEIFLSKRTHLKTLLLATYYNFWGPTHYWPLLSQGAAGEGDKETFVAAATVANEPFYQVSEPICAIGHRTAGGLAGSAMAQFNPVEDYMLTQKDQWRIMGAKALPPQTYVIHANFPKFNPATVFNPGDVNPAFADDGSYTRAWTIPEEVIEKFPTDVEREFWSEILWTACELEDKFETWKGQANICRKVKDYWNAIFVDSKSGAV
ncbi:alpha-mannosyltransferase [Aspergillus ruber CBS 135680]|uniref:Putative alpha-1,2-mannosyltransferase n=1 Tax=Aspergillus ruber (strain CBS 135680) TaxID=1388766 RepID=A0A017S337_ASPRC|nr:putative alpha-1,2-mannosyltransferase [Aspergillus ruber CBS 135680]EYE90560.1 putative alpha-1,2-mannosyltransferase [Aspergillus ruber CBS 135680]